MDDSSSSTSALRPSDPFSMSTSFSCRISTSLRRSDATASASVMASIASSASACFVFSSAASRRCGHSGANDSEKAHAHTTAGLSRDR
jgi:hypothetical protein